MTTDVAIVGAGLAGLACARALSARGVDCMVFEASDAVGGRVRTDTISGFQIDRGFQVLLTAYPEARAVLEYGRLDLQPFEPGALVWHGGRFHRIGDPFRRPLQAVPTLLARVGSLTDKVRVLRLRQAVVRGAVDDIWAMPEMTTEAALRDRYGFSERMVDRFFRPFLGGVFLDRSLADSSRAFEFYIRMFSAGMAAVPAAGMRAIPEQLAAGLPADVIHLGARVTSVEAGEVHILDGEAVSCRAVVVATDAPAVRELLPEVAVPPSKSTVHIAWAADEPPRNEAVLMLDGEGDGPVNNVQVMSSVAPSYAPAGKALITASVVGPTDGTDSDVERAARAQLRGWFGNAVDDWRRLQTHHIYHALPALASLQSPERPSRVRDGLYVTGDHRRNGSINGALVAGRHAAEAVVADLGAG